MNSIYKWCVIALSLFFVGCTSVVEHRYINIKPPSFSAEMIPQQMNSFLIDNDFKRINFSARVRDPKALATDALNMKTGQVLESYNSFMMRYQHNTISSLLVNVTIGKDRGDIKLEFYEMNNKEFSPESSDVYNQFKENLKIRLYDEKDFTAT